MTGLKRGEPLVLVLTDVSAQEARDRFSSNYPEFVKAEAAGLVYYVDTFSKSIGIADKDPYTAYVDSLANFNAVNLAVNAAQRKLVGHHAQHRFVFDNLSTLIAQTNTQTAFRFLHVLMGRVRAAGGTSVLLLDRGMHDETDVQTIQHLAACVVEMKKDQNRYLLRVEGHAPSSHGWVDYRFTPKSLELTGSFATGRIR